jgi:hypothetical protein
METWQELLAKNGMKVEKLRKQVQKDISDYEDAINYLTSAKTALQSEEDDDKKAEIQKDIEEIEADLPELINDITEGVKKDIATLEKRRDTARKAFSGKGKGQNSEPAPNPKPADPKPADPVANPAPVDPAPVNPEVIDKEKKGGNIIEWVVGGALVIGLGYLGIAFNKDLFPFKKR